jgi:hypothetical protein
MASLVIFTPELVRFMLVGGTIIAALAIGVVWRRS